MARIFKTKTDKRSYLAEQIDDTNCVLRLDDEFKTSIGYIPLDLVEDSLEWQEDAKNNRLLELFEAMNPKPF